MDRPGFDLSDRTAVGTGLVAGVALPLVQYAFWRFLPTIAAPGGDPGIGMALFVAVGVVIPAGAIAALFEDSPTAGLTGTGTYPLAALAAAAVLPMPAWFLPGVVVTAVVFGVAVLLGGIPGEVTGSGGEAGE